MYPRKLVLGNDCAVGAGICARTAVQASAGVDDELIVTLSDSTSGASIGASAAADACRSNLVCHWNCTSIKIVHSL